MESWYGSGLIATDSSLCAQINGDLGASDQAAKGSEMAKKSKILTRARFGDLNLRAKGCGCSSCVPLIEALAFIEDHLLPVVRLASKENTNNLGDLATHILDEGGY